MARVRIGTSGWMYRHWQGPFYPPGLAAARWLPHYADRFDTVELNTSFYRRPPRPTFEAWRDATPSDFLFAVKAHRFITHRKKLRDPPQTLSPFLANAAGLGPKLGPVLFQLPPRWAPNLERLEAFLRACPPAPRIAFEFRDPAWIAPRILDALARHGAAFCIYEFDFRLSPKHVTADFVYIRLHGPLGRYRGCYSEAALAGWARDIERWAGEGRDVFCYFDNDERGFAAKNAGELKARLRLG